MTTLTGIAAEWLPNSADEINIWEALCDYIRAEIRDEHGSDADLAGPLFTR